MPDPPKDAKSIFLAAVDITDAAERAAFVERSCGGDAVLKKRVDDLLRAYAQPDGPLDKLAAALASTEISEPIREQVGAAIGPYKLMEQIGEGGFGLVFVAEQQAPIRRKVALKIIKPGMDTRDVIARFEAERQALALMDHPNIARVLDAGTTQSGHPYFVMELVRGVPITEYCDKHQLTPRERLELFVPVCNAIQHAHLKGIIHRDIKPSNVLVTLHDGKPVVKVIDFGVAKALHQQLTDRTIYTRFAQMIGTPLYMSPEQAEMSGLDIDTRTDVYSLGVLLYELLTGSTPFDKKRLAKAAYDELLKIIREEDPPKPSLRLSQSSDSLPSIAAMRKTEPAKLSKMFSGDLDWIAMKALEKDRTRRYETANAFAADVLRYLNDEPVEASPPSTGYRLRKLARKHRAALVTVGSFTALLIAGILVSGWLAIREKSARKSSERNAALASDAANEAHKEAQRADASATQARRGQREAEIERDRAEHALYANHIASAYREWQTNNFEAAWKNLIATRKELRGWEYNFLYTLFTKNQKKLIGHADFVYGVAFSPDGKRIASASRDNTVKLWDAASGREILTFKRHTAFATSVAFSPDGKRIASGSRDGTVKLWDAANGQEFLTLKGPAFWVTSVAFSPDGKRIASGTIDNMIDVWDAVSGRRILDIKGHAVGPSVTGVSFSPDSRQIASGSDDNTITLWDATNGREIRTLRGHTEAVKSVAFSPDGKRIASGSRDNTAKVWDVTSGRQILTLKGHTGAVVSVAFSPEGKRIASGSWDNTIKLWDSSSGDEIVAFKGHARGGLWSDGVKVAFSPDGTRIASGGGGRIVILWDVEGSRETLTLKAHMDSGPVDSVAFSPDGQRIASGSDDQTVKLWDVASGREVLILKGRTVAEDEKGLEGAAVASVAFSPDGKRLASGDGVIKLWDVGSTREVFTFEGSTAVIAHVAFSPDGKRLASGTVDGTIRLWDAATGKVILTLKGHRKRVTSVAFSPDGQRVVSGGGDDQMVKLWDLASRNVIMTLKGHRDGIASVAFSPNGKQFASAGADTTIKLWEAATGREIFTLEGHLSQVNCVAFSPDGKRLASGSIDGDVKLWDVASGRELLTFKLPTYWVNSLTFSPDGNRLASANGNGTITLWDARGGH